jgi:acyl-coenzyme A synthetase/AMP-(fatty) acid ligase
MYINFLLEQFDHTCAKDAIVWRERNFTYGWMREAVDQWTSFLQKNSVKTGTVVSLESDFSPNAAALMIALVGTGCVIVPLSSTTAGQRAERRHTAEVEVIVQVSTEDEVHVERIGRRASHPLLQQLRNAGHPGLVLFSSGSTGQSKAAVHDFVPLLQKFKTPRNTLRTLTFLLFDHIGGINTLFYTLANAGCVVTVDNRSPDIVCAAIERHDVQLLPTSPTFINLMLVSQAYQRHDLSSLEMVSYGTEVMPESTLQRLHQLFPQIRLLQTYGLSEVGILRSKSKSSDSLWVKVGGDGFETRIVDSMLEVKSRSAMLGYLNSPYPFTEDGWFKTGDAVEVDGEYVRILGRSSDLINVGGEKVYPAEVESVLQTMYGVEEVAVNGELNPIVGHIVVAKVKLSHIETAKEFRRRMRDHCNGKLERYKIPQKVEIVSENIHGERFKKIRRPTADSF